MKNCAAEAYDWYVLTVVPGRERAVQASLRRVVRHDPALGDFDAVKATRGVRLPLSQEIRLTGGVRALLPMRAVNVSRRLGAKLKRKGIERRNYPLIPGYLFVRVPAGQLTAWGHILGQDDVTGVLSDDDQPRRMCRRDVDILLRHLKTESNKMALWRKFVVGDMVEFIGGAMAGHPMHCEQVRGNIVQLRWEGMGRVVPIQARVDELAKSDYQPKRA